MPTSTLDSADLLASIVADGHIVVPIARLTEVLDATPREIRDAGRTLVKRNLVAWWVEAPNGAAVCLTPLAIESLGLEPDEAGERWRPAGSRPRPERFGGGKAVADSQLRDDGTSVFDSVPDRSALDPAKVADHHEQERLAMMRVEEEDAYDRRRPTARADALMELRTKPPLLILGIGAQWPVAFESGSRCDVCQGERRSFFCCVCCSSSQDRILGPPPSEKTLNRQAVRAAKQSALMGGVGVQKSDRKRRKRAARC